MDSVNAAAAATHKHVRIKAALDRAAEMLKFQRDDLEAAHFDKGRFTGSNEDSMMLVTLSSLIVELEDCSEIVEQEFAPTKAPSPYPDPETIALAKFAAKDGYREPETIEEIQLAIEGLKIKLALKRSPVSVKG
jgi:hypothetical protein